MCGVGKKVSVIVPVYGSEAYLEKCVASLTAQTYQNLEIILVDDGSPDRCPQMCDQWAERDLRIRVIHKKNGGLSSARNAGIAVATGEFLSFVDSDDWIALDTYEKVMHLFDAFDPDIVTFDCNLVNEKLEVYGTTEKLREGILTAEEALQELLRGQINNYAGNKVYKKHIFADIRFPEGRLWEDMAIAYQLFSVAKSIYCYPVPLYFYYRRRDGMSKNINEKALAHIFLARYECHTAMQVTYPALQKFSLPMAALSARRLYDRSLWKDVDAETLALAMAFLHQNRKTVLTEIKDKKYWLYYHFPSLYKVLRILRHKAGDLVKKIKR